MEHYKVRVGSFSEIRKMIIFRTIPMVVIAMGGAVAISEFNPNKDKPSLHMWGMLTPFFIVLIAYSIYRSLKKQKKIFESYELTIDEEYITRTQYNTPDIRLGRGEVQSINKTVNSSFAIKGKSILNIIIVPAQIEDYERLEATLNSISPITQKTTEPILSRFQLIFVLLGTILMAATFISTNKIIVGISGTLLSTLFIYNLIVINKSKNMERSIKRNSWISLIVLASILFTMYWKIFN